MIGFDTAKARNVSSLQNWVNGNACLARDETAYLQAKDLTSVVSASDDTITRVEELVEDGLIYLYKGFRDVSVFLPE